MDEEFFPPRWNRTVKGTYIYNWGGYTLSVSTTEIKCHSLSGQKFSCPAHSDIEKSKELALRRAKTHHTNLRVSAACRIQHKRRVVLLVPYKHIVTVYDIKKRGPDKLGTSFVFENVDGVDYSKVPEFTVKYAHTNVGNFGSIWGIQDGMAFRHPQVTVRDSMDWYIYKPEQYIHGTVHCVQCGNDVDCEGFQCHYVHGLGLRCGVCLDQLEENTKHHFWDRE